MPLNYNVVLKNYKELINSEIYFIVIKGPQFLD